jgi:hypothetical protein
MAAQFFDRLTRSLSAAHTRRGLTRWLSSVTFGGPFVLLSLAEAEAKKKRTKKRKKRKTKRGGSSAPLAVPPPPSGSSCIPDCAGKTCGGDGCGGTCGPCTRGTCLDGLCACPSGQGVCHGDCFPECRNVEVRDPACGCCTPADGECGDHTDCCSGICRNDYKYLFYCVGREHGVTCSFDDQCFSRVCQDGRCTCAGDICAGLCRTPCTSSDATRDWNSCDCCRKNGSSCSTHSQCCSRDCDGGTCQGLPAGIPCTFDAQCASENCSNSLDVCSGGIGG